MQQHSFYQSLIEISGGVCTLTHEASSDTLRWFRGVVAPEIFFGSSRNGCIPQVVAV